MNSQKQEFSTFDVLKILDIKRERLREWMNQGFIIPTSPAKGVGTKAAFNILGLYQIAVFKKLVEAGINRRKASALVHSNPRIKSEKDVKQLRYIMVFEGDGTTRWESYMSPGPWKMEQNIKKYKDWDVGLLINFERIKSNIQKSL